VDAIDSIAVIAAPADVPGEMNDFSANEFEKRALIGFARSSRTARSVSACRRTRPSASRRSTTWAAGSWSSARTCSCAGRAVQQLLRLPRGPSRGRTRVDQSQSLAALLPAHDLNIPKAQFQIINFEQTIGPVVAAKCVSCHQPVGATPAAGGLDLTAVLTRCA